MANTKITNPKLFNLGDSTSATQLPVMTFAERNAIPNTSIGETIFNSDTDKVEYFDGTKWYGINMGFPLKFDSNRLYYYQVSGASVTEDGRLFKGNKNQVTGQYEGECQTNFYFNNGDTGKYYMEMEMPSDVNYGIHSLAFTDATAYTGAQADNSYFHRIGYYVSIEYGTQINPSRAAYRAGTGADTDSRTFSGITTAGEAVAMAVDTSNRKVWYGKLTTSGVVSWFGGGNPATNSTPTFTLPSGWGEYRLSAADGSWSGSTGRYGWFRIRETAEISEGIPSGFSYMQGVYGV